MTTTTKTPMTPSRRRKIGQDGFNSNIGVQDGDEDRTDSDTDESSSSSSSVMSLSTEAMIPLPSNHDSHTYKKQQQRRQRQREHDRRRRQRDKLGNGDTNHRLPTPIRHAIISLRLEDCVIATTSAASSLMGVGDQGRWMIKRNLQFEDYFDRTQQAQQQNIMVWEDLEDDLFLLLNGRMEIFQKFQSLYFDLTTTTTTTESVIHTHKSSSAVVNPSSLSEMFRSMAYLFSSSSSSNNNNNNNNKDDTRKTMGGGIVDMKLHDEHIQRLVRFFCTPDATTASGSSSSSHIIDSSNLPDTTSAKMTTATSTPSSVKEGRQWQKERILTVFVECLLLQTTNIDNNSNSDADLSKTIHQSSQSPVAVLPPNIGSSILEFLTVRESDDWPIQLLPTNNNNNNEKIDDSDGDNDNSGAEDTHIIMAAMLLLYELRAQCLRYQEMDNEQRAYRVQRMAQSSEEAAMMIATGAKLVELGIHQSNRAIQRKIHSAGEVAKQWVDVEDEPLILDRDAVVAMAFSDTAKRASEYAREGSKVVLESIMDASISGVHYVGNHLSKGSDDPPKGDCDTTTRAGSPTNNYKIGRGRDRKVLTPSCERREMLKAAGKVGMAAVGAAAVVGEAVAHTTRSVASKTAGVAADVVGHKYGATAGDVVKNAGETAGNLVRAASNVALLDTNVFAKHVAKNAGKQQVDQDVQKAKQRIERIEKRVSSMMSNTLGIRIDGNWVGQIESFSTENDGYIHSSSTVQADQNDHEGQISEHTNGDNQAEASQTYHHTPNDVFTIRSAIKNQDAQRYSEQQIPFSTDSETPLSEHGSTTSTVSTGDSTAKTDQQISPSQRLVINSAGGSGGSSSSDNVNRTSSSPSTKLYPSCHHSSASIPKSNQ